MADQENAPAKYEPSGKFSTDYLHHCKMLEKPALATVQSPPLTSRIANFVEQSNPSNTKLYPRILTDSTPDAAPSEVEIQHVALTTADLDAILLGLEGCQSTTTLRFSNVKFLDESALSRISTSVAVLPLTTLSFTSCQQSFAAAHWKALLEEPKSSNDSTGTGCISSLSVRCCALDDAAAAGIGQGLSGNKQLLHLNLFGNRLTSQGCTEILSGLRSNRHLQSLDLSNNRITDWAVGPLCELLTQLHLTPEEAKILRRETIRSCNETVESRPSTPTRLSSTKKRTPSSAKLQKKNKSSASLKKLPAKSQAQLEVPLMSTPHPFLIDNKHDQEYNWTCRGNRELKFLNLSYNQLTEQSLNLLVAAIAQCANEASDDGAEVITIHAHSHTRTNKVVPCSSTHRLTVACSRSHEPSDSTVAIGPCAFAGRNYHCCPIVMLTVCVVMTN
eukprot:m.233350 g.233350  ORF g.233350 m.233350 type:complete len:446 (-) comp17382_c0_seq1:3602-4939(-)